MTVRGGWDDTGGGWDGVSVQPVARANFQLYNFTNFQLIHSSLEVSLNYPTIRLFSYLTIY